MSRGGARSRSGPAPDPNALRRSRATDPAWTKIPAAGRGKPAPECPLEDPTVVELALWEKWWALPVAVLWDEESGVDYVALAVRTYAESVKPKGRTEDRKNAKPMMSDLLLNPDARLQRRIVVVDDVEADSAAVEVPSNVTDIKNRLASNQ